MITLTHISVDEIAMIRDLWEQNRLYHVAISEHFRQDYEHLRFEDRMKPLAALPESALKITVAKNGEALCGYCISTAKDSSGELVSLHVLDSMRGKGVGKLLTENHLQWLKEKDCKEISVHVAAENGSTIGFYERLGLRKNYMTMQLKE